MQGITHGQTVHHGSQHTHVVAHHAVHARLGKTGTTEQVAATDDQTDLNTQLNQFFDLWAIRSSTAGSMPNPRILAGLHHSTSEEHVCMQAWIGTHVTDSWSYKRPRHKSRSGETENRFD